MGKSTLVCENIIPIACCYTPLPLPLHLTVLHPTSDIVHTCTCSSVTLATTLLLCAKQSTTWSQFRRTLNPLVRTLPHFFSFSLSLSLALTVFFLQIQRPSTQSCEFCECIRREVNLLFLLLWLYSYENCPPPATLDPPLLSPPYIVRTILIYTRSHCMPVYRGDPTVSTVCVVAYVLHCIALCVLTPGSVVHYTRLELSISSMCLVLIRVHAPVNQVETLALPC